MRTCYIVGAGDFTPRGLCPGEGDLVIAADGGYLALQAHGIRPHLLMGDFDSLPNPPQDLPIQRFPVEKDDTDTGIALRYGWQLGYRSFALYGCSGGRTDHLLANLQSMGHYSRMGARIRLAAVDHDAYALTNGTLVLPPLPAGATVSVFCHGERAEGVTLQNLYYPLQDAVLTCDMPLGVSNHTLDEDHPAQITVAHGTLLILAACAPSERM